MWLESQWCSVKSCRAQHWDAEVLGWLLAAFALSSWPSTARLPRSPRAVSCHLPRTDWVGKDWKSLFIGVLRVFLQVPFYSVVPLEALEVFSPFERCLCMLREFVRKCKVLGVNSHHCWSYILAFHWTRLKRIKGKWESFCEIMQRGPS